MRPISQFPPVNKQSTSAKQLTSDTVQGSPPSTSRFAQVFAATIQNSQPAAAPQARLAGGTRATAPRTELPLSSRLRTTERALRVHPQLARGNSSPTTPVLPSPQRHALRTETLAQPQKAGAGQSTEAKATIAQPQKVEVGQSTEAKATIKTYGTMITATAQECGVDPALSMAVARAESGISAATDKEVVLNHRAVSYNGTSFGLFQLANATGKELLQEYSPGQTYNPFNPSQNICLGINYLKDLAEMFSADTKLRKGLSTTAGADDQEVRRLSIAAYNAGPGRVARAQATVLAQGGNPGRYQDIEPYLPKETQVYVRRVEKYATEFRGSDTVLA